jgi:hypothetical protein
MSSSKLKVLFPGLIVLLAAALFGFAALSAEAQTFRGGIHGRVEDPSGALLGGAHVRVVSATNGQIYSTATTSAGEFSILDLPLGSYSLTVTHPGFESVSVLQIKVDAGSIYNLSLKLTVGKVNEKVTVVAAAVSLDTTSVVQSEIIPTTTVQSIPLNGRDFTQLLTVTPGYSGYGVGFMSAINGAQATQINWQIEGVDNNDLWIGTTATNQGGVNGIPGVLLPIDSVDEFSLVTQQSAESGRSPGGTVNLVLKSGSNAVHGSVYYYNRNEALAASSVFAQSGSDSVTNKPLRDQQFGFSVGGPILKNRTFYFASFERQQFDIGITVPTTEPSAAYQTEALSVLANAGQAYGSYAPVAPNPVSVKLLANLWPSSALNGLAVPGNYLNPGSENGYSNNGLVKLDHEFNEANRLSLRAFVGQGHQLAPTSSYLSPYFETAPTHVQNWSLIFNSVLSPRLTNQAFFGFNFFSQTFADADRNFNAAASGLNTGVTDPVLSGAPEIELGTNGGFDPIGVTPYSGRRDTTWHVNDIVSYNLGRHSLRVGGEFRRAGIDEFNHTNGRGSFVFDGGQGPWATSTAISDGNVLVLADFLAGYVYQSSIVQGNPARSLHSNGFSLFAQDNFQVTRRLNINYGLRYDFNQPIQDGRNDLSVFLPGSGLAVVGSGLKSLYPDDWKNFGPRLGFAFQPAGNESLVLRGGVGISFDTVNASSFLGVGNIFNGGATGAQYNPVGSNPVSALSLNNYTLPAAGTPIAWPVNQYNNIFSVSQHLATPRLYNYNLNLEQALGRAAVAQLGYVGSVGRHLLEINDINQALPGSDFTLAPGAPNTTRPYYAAFPQFGTINQVSSGGTSNYNSLQATLKVASWHGVTSQFAYTWAHTLDYGSFLVLPQNSFNRKAEYGNSDFDMRHNFTAFVSYSLPNFTHGKALANGWKLSSLVSFRSGLPFSVNAYGDVSGTGENADRPNLTGNPYAGISHSVVDHQGVYWINANAFSVNYGEFGTMRRNQLFGPGFGSVDLTVLKETAITEQVKTQFRVEIFNLFNRINLGNPTFTGANGIIPVPGYGNFGIPITYTNGAQFGLPGIGPGEPFNVQLAFKILF